MSTLSIFFESAEREDGSSVQSGDGSPGCSGSSASGDESELHFVGQTYNSSYLVRCFRKKYCDGQLYAQVCCVCGRLDQSMRIKSDTVFGQDFFHLLDESFLEFFVGILFQPEIFHSTAEALGIFAGKGRAGQGECPGNRFAHQFRINERVVAHEEEFCGNAFGKFANVFRPAFEFKRIKAKYSRKECFGGNGNMWA